MTTMPSFSVCHCRLQWRRYRSWLSMLILCVSSSFLYPVASQCLSNWWLDIMGKHRRSSTAISFCTLSPSSTNHHCPYICLVHDFFSIQYSPSSCQPQNNNKTHRVAQKMYDVFWHPGQENLADYQSKHHVGSHHFNLRPYYLHVDKSPRWLIVFLRRIHT